MYGAFRGVWVPMPGITLYGRFVMQCKFSSRPGRRLSIADLESDIVKVQALAREGMCDAYLLMTNAGMSGRTRVALEKRLRAAGVDQSLVLQSGWLEEQIRTSKRLRMLVPQMYGLGDLTQILDSRSEEHTSELQSLMRISYAVLCLKKKT